MFNFLIYKRIIYLKLFIILINNQYHYDNFTESSLILSFFLLSYLLINIPFSLSLTNNIILSLNLDEVHL